MKKADLLILAGTLLCSALFYKQLAGLNFTVFTFAFCIMLAALHPERLREPRWWLFVLPCLLSASSVFLVNTVLSVFATLASCLVLAAKTVNPQTSVLMAGFTSFFSSVLAPFDLMREITEAPADGQSQRRKKNATAVVVASVVTIPFLFLYRGSNPLFDRFVHTIDLSWFSFQWFLFTLVCGCLIFGLLKLCAARWLNPLVNKMTDNIGSPAQSSGSESLIGTVLFALLNLMLVCINALDVYYLFVDQHLPEGITLSGFVHDAVACTIFSIVFAVALIAYLFRKGSTPSARYLKLVVLLWILQTTLVVFNTVVRNTWYVAEFQLTEQRIGVYVFLLLSLFGLAFTWNKIQQNKTTWWLLKANVQAWFFVLVCSSLINWGRFITGFNITQAETKHKKLDVFYLLQLDDTNLPQLVALNQRQPFQDYDLADLKEKVARTYRKIRFQTWPSYSLRLLENEKAIETFRNHENQD